MVAVETPEYQQALDGFMKQVTASIAAEHQRLRTDLQADLEQHEAVLRKLLESMRHEVGHSAPHLFRSSVARTGTGDKLRSRHITAEFEGLKHTKTPAVFVSPLEGEPEGGVLDPEAAPMEEVAQPVASIEEMTTAQKRHHEKLSYKKREEKSRLFQFVQGRCFTATISWVIIIQTIVVGVQVEAAASFSGYYESDGALAVELVLAVIFSVIYTVELVLRMLAYRWFFWKEPELSWNVIDTVLTATSWAEVGLQVARRIDEVGGQELKSIAAFRAVRIIRLIRILRVVRTVAFFKPLRLLVAAMMGATRSCFWLLALLALVMYTFGLVFTQACTDWLEEHPLPENAGPGPENAGPGPGNDVWKVQEFYGSLFRSMYTLFRAMSGGVSWAEPAHSLGVVSTWYEGVFSFFMFFSFFIFLNVVTGVFCSMAQEAAFADTEEQLAALMQDKEQYMQELLDIFQELDDFGGDSPEGTFTLQELEEFVKDVRIQGTFSRLELDLDDAWSFFRLFDTGDGLINLEEFIQGCKKMKGEAKAIDMQIMLHDVQTIRKRSYAMERSLADLRRQILNELRSLRGEESLEVAPERVQSAASNTVST